MSDSEFDTFEDIGLPTGSGGSAPTPVVLLEDPLKFDTLAPGRLYEAFYQYWEEQINTIRSNPSKLHAEFTAARQFEVSPLMQRRLVPQDSHTLARNRYSNVVPTASTRVVLAERWGFSCDYINANHVTYHVRELAHLDHAVSSSLHHASQHGHPPEVVDGDHGMLVAPALSHLHSPSSSGHHVSRTGTASKATPLDTFSTPAGAQPMATPASGAAPGLPPSSCSAGSTCYVAAQAPLASQLAEFWSMVWQEEASVIVMLTKLVERGQCKADQYWPADCHSSVTYGCIEVQRAECQVRAPDGGPDRFHPSVIEQGGGVKRAYGVIQREFLIRDNSQETKHAGDEAVWRHVTLLQYADWPDYGVPDDTAFVLPLLQHIAFIRSARRGNSIIHCSAGIGRTGTLVAIDALWRLLLRYDVLRMVSWGGPLVDEEAAEAAAHAAAGKSLKDGGVGAPHVDTSHGGGVGRTPGRRSSDAMDTPMMNMPTTSLHERRAGSKAWTPVPMRPMHMWTEPSPTGLHNSGIEGDADEAMGDAPASPMAHDVSGDDPVILGMNRRTPSPERPHNGGRWKMHKTPSPGHGLDDSNMAIDTPSPPSSRTGGRTERRGNMVVPAELQREVDILGLVKSLKTQRCGMVMTSEQYGMIFSSVTNLLLQAGVE